MNKQEFINEITKRGVIDVDKLPTSTLFDQWVFYGGKDVDYNDLSTYGVYIHNVHLRNPPTNVSDIEFYDFSLSQFVEEIDTTWLLARIDELPFVGEVPPPIECDKPTPHFSSGCELLLAYDKDYDGLINLDELNQSYTDFENGVITEEEFDFVSDAYINDGINVVCAGCYTAPAPAVRHVAQPVDEKTKSPIAGAEVYICEEPEPFASNISGLGHCAPGTFLGAPPLDITFCLGCDYKLGTAYTIVVRAEGYISGNIRRTYAPGEDLTLSLGLCSCTGPTTHFSSGRDLLQHYDANSDGIIIEDDVSNAVYDCYVDGTITVDEMYAVMEVWVNGGSIDAMCPGKKTVTFESVPVDAIVKVD